MKPALTAGVVVVYLAVLIVGLLGVHALAIGLVGLVAAAVLALCLAGWLA